MTKERVGHPSIITEKNNGRGLRPLRFRPTYAEANVGHPSISLAVNYG
jgi:hypothetical protein